MPYVVTKYLIEMGWFCYECAENIGSSYIEQTKSCAGFRCYECKREFGEGEDG